MGREGPNRRLTNIAFRVEHPNVNNSEWVGNSTALYSGGRSNGVRSRSWQFASNWTRVSPNAAT